jgi:hypothetical protein
MPSDRTGPNGVAAAASLGGNGEGGRPKARATLDRAGERDIGGTERAGAPQRRARGGLEGHAAARPNPVGRRRGRKAGRPMIAEEALQFIRASIKSVWALELLLFLRRNRAQAWTVDGLTDELRSSRFVVAQVTETFEAAGLISKEGEGAFRYRPANSEIDRIIGLVEIEYGQRPTAVVKAILSAPNDKIQTFADAFKLLKE